MSAVIFVVLAVGWAAYLIPQALKRHDDLARSRPIEEFSAAVRVVGKGRSPVATTSAAATKAPAAPSRAHRITRESARRAARRRRRVLAALLAALAAVSVTSYLAYTPWWSTAIPGGLVLVFLLVARLTVRAQQVRVAASPVAEDVTAAATAVAVEIEPDLGTEDTVGVSREELAAAIAAPVLDEGGLWDPLPMTLPTYVNKPRARRTVRTVELTNVTSSGHDAADSALAREAEEAAEQTRSEAEATEADQKAAGA